MSTIGRQPLRLAILISGRGSNMTAVARACLQKRLAASVTVVIADRPAAAGIEVAQQMGLETHVIEWHGGAGQAETELALGQCLDAYDPDLIVLAGFMRVLSETFVKKYAGRMINIHPSLLPQYRGLHTHRRVLESGDTTHGASVHFVTPELDSGPVILQSRVPVRAGDTEATLAARVLTTEHVIYPKVIGWIADGRLAWNGGRPSLDAKPLDAPIVEEMSGDAAG